MLSYTENDIKMKVDRIQGVENVLVLAVNSYQRSVSQGWTSGQLNDKNGRGY